MNNLLSAEEKLVSSRSEAVDSIKTFTHQVSLRYHGTCCTLFKSSPQSSENIMSTEELVKCIQDAIQLLENYRMFGPMVEEGITAFKKINECVIDPTIEAKREAKDLIDKMQQEIGPYKAMVPQVAEAIEKLEKWSIK
jgi:hypothetical protein